MTYYTYDCPDHGEFQAEYVFGEAPRWALCPWAMHKAPRSYGRSNMQFTYGKESFHGPTIGEKLEADRKEWADAGIKAEPVGERWV